MAFARKIITLTFTKGAGTFAGTNSNRLTISGLRVQCVIINVNGPGMGKATLRIFGLTPSQLNDLSALNGGLMQFRQIALQIQAGDAGSEPYLVFEGQVILGQIDLNSQPDSALLVVAMAGMLQAATSSPPTSYPVDTNHFVVLKNLAAQMGMNFDPHGNPVSLSRPYFWGSLRDQVMRCADAANVSWYINNNTLTVYPRFGSVGVALPVVSPQSGMVGYPSYSQNTGIAVKMLFNPLLRNGAEVPVESSLPFATGTWIAYYIRHELDSGTPNGIWFTSFEGQPKGGYVQQ